jgi:putative membrane protein
MRLSPETTKNIEAAFVAAQARTRAPIVCVLAESSADHALIPVLVAALIALAAPWPLLALTSLAPQHVYLIQLALFLLALALVAWTPLAMALVPRARGHAAGHRAALVQFGLRGLHRAPERNAVLVYVSLAERYARVVADAGLDGKLSQADWRGLIDELVAAMRRGEPEAALRGAAARLVELLGPHFPALAGAEPPRGPHFHAL